MLAQYEWEDKTGLRHPSLVQLDVTGVNPDNLTLSLDDILSQSNVIRVMPIDSIGDMFTPRGTLDHRRVRPPLGFEDYRQCWHHKATDMERYALFVAYRREE